MRTLVEACELIFTDTPFQNRADRLVVHLTAAMQLSKQINISIPSTLVQNSEEVH